MSTKVIIAMVGHSGSGKDTSCDMLVNQFDFKKTAFATPLKQMAKIAFPDFTDADLYGPSSLRETEYKQYPFGGTCLGCGKECELNEEKQKYTCMNCCLEYPPYVSPRAALTTLGTEWGRRLYPDIWAEAAVRTAQADPHPLWCLSDLRFHNEVDAVRNAGGRLIYLTRKEPAPGQRNLHASEASIASIRDRCDWVIDNANMELSELYRSMGEILRFLRGDQEGLR